MKLRNNKIKYQRHEHLHLVGYQTEQKLRQKESKNKKN